MDRNNSPDDYNTVVVRLIVTFTSYIHELHSRAMGQRRQIGNKEETCHSNHVAIALVYSFPAYSSTNKYSEGKLPISVASPGSDSSCLSLRHEAVNSTFKSPAGLDRVMA